ncbi:hypothetical protein [uncultured Lactobacillus sp.]|uniref:hypothetical protein n=1 Tax=uncultured Lactobacillus sp. TaxID=153152 RepID=UPI00280583E5|nr:hypothetical protein [uncultured Lactobacillus sp.]
MKILKNIFALSIAGIILISGVAITTPTVQATSAYDNWVKKDSNKSSLYKVVVTKPITIYKAKFRGFYVFKGKAEHVKPGTILYIHTYGDKGEDWIMTHSKSSNVTKFYPHKTVGWFDTYSKHEYVDQGYFLGKKNRVGKGYTFTWNQYVKLVKMGLWTTNRHDQSWKKITKYVESLDLIAE